MARSYGSKNFSAREKRQQAVIAELKARLKAMGEALKNAKNDRK